MESETAKKSTDIKTSKPVQMTAVFINGILLSFIFVFIAYRVINFFDNDTYWMIATGREILKQGTLPKYNPVSIQSHLPFVVHQWLYTVLVTVLHDRIGKWSLSVLTTGLLITTDYLTYCYAKSFLKQKYLAFVVTSCMFLFYLGFFVCRPTSFSIPIFLTSIICWRKAGKNKKWLIAIPLLSLLEANVHTSIWIMYPVFSLPFIMPETLPVNISLKDYLKEWISSKKTHFIAYAGAVLAGLVNPYGVQGAMYPILSYGTVTGYYIQELQAPEFASSIGVAILLIGILLAYYVVRLFKNTENNNEKQLNLNYYFLAIGCYILSCMHLRNLWFIGLAIIPFFAVFLDRFSFKTVSGAIKGIGNKIIAVIIACVVCACMLPNVPSRSDLEDTLPEKIVSYLEENKTKDVRIYGGFNVGGFLEYKGYKPYIDARPEIYSKCINKTEDVYQEYLKVASGRIDYKKWLEKYDFDVFIVCETPLQIYLEMSPDYKFVMQDGMYSLFEKT